MQVWNDTTRIDWAERHHPLNTVAMASHVGLEARVVSLLQDKLLAVVAAVLKPHPAGYQRKGQTRTMR